MKPYYSKTYSTVVLERGRGEFKWEEIEGEIERGRENESGK